MANFKEQQEQTTLLRNNMLKAMSKPRTAREISEICGISCYNSQYHISCLLKEGYAKHVGMSKGKFAPANLYKKIGNMGEYVMQARKLSETKQEKLTKHQPVKSSNSTIYNHFNDEEHFAKMNASRNKPTMTYSVSGGILSGVF